MGVWVGGRKIAAIGIAASRWVSTHGVALNVSIDTGGFDLIVPCGIADRGVTSMSAEGADAPMPEVKRRFARLFCEVFGFAGDVAAVARPSSGPVRTRLPQWMRRPISPAGEAARVRRLLDEAGLHSVCSAAHCPNRAECFARGTATFMILGDVCTRSCRFCAVPHGVPGPVRPDEPRAVARAAAELGLRHVVVTSVTRDDLPDGGAGHFADTIRAVRERLPVAGVEVLTPDFLGRGDAIDAVLDAAPDVFNHNLETVERLSTELRPQADYRRSLEVLARAGRRNEHVKSGLMLGLGETEAELPAALRDLRAAGCSLLTLGQYLAPSPAHAPVARFVPPEEFDRWRCMALEMGFTAVAAGPLVRSSYRAEGLVSGGCGLDGGARDDATDVTGERRITRM